MASRHILHGGLKNFKSRIFHVMSPSRLPHLGKISLKVLAVVWSFPIDILLQFSALSHRINARAPTYSNQYEETFIHYPN
jgi:hypothetical protein